MCRSRRAPSRYPTANFNHSTSASYRGREIKLISSVSTKRAQGKQQVQSSWNSTSMCNQRPCANAMHITAIIPIPLDGSPIQILNRLSAFGLLDLAHLMHPTGTKQTHILLDERLHPQQCVNLNAIGLRFRIVVSVQDRTKHRGKKHAGTLCFVFRELAAHGHKRVFTPSAFPVHHQEQTMPCQHATVTPR